MREIWELAQLGARSPLEGPLPWVSSGLVTPSPDDRSSMSSGSAKDQQGHLLVAVQLLYPLVKDLGLFLPNLATGPPWESRWHVEGHMLDGGDECRGIKRRARKAVMK